MLLDLFQSDQQTGIYYRFTYYVDICFNTIRLAQLYLMAKHLQSIEFCRTITNSSISSIILMIF